MLASTQPVYFSAIKKNEKVSAGSNETLSKWREHYEGILDVISSSDQAALNAVENLPMKCELPDPPDKDEIESPWETDFG